MTEALNQLEAWWGNLRKRNVRLPSVPDGVEAGDIEVSATQVADRDDDNDQEEKDEVVHGSSQQAPPHQQKKSTPRKRSKTCSKLKHAHMTPEGTAVSAAKAGVSEFNKSASRVGRPPKARVAAGAQRSKDRKEYNNGTKLRNALRGDDELDVEEFLKERQPPLIELSSFLKTFEVRFGGHKKS
ncbi:hypothetical protein PR002_g13579 [Phytophthora rubi]|nr:hypothetical protein PR002_g13579 [Phytophthora rubi]